MAGRTKPADSYNADSLAELEGLTAVRKRPGMYIGSTDERGLQHCLWEIVDNSVDEAIAGHCTSISITLHADGSVEVGDDGRGIPVDIEPRSGLPGVVLVLTKLHAGGKFGTGGYKVAGGLHGVGASVVNALSERLDATVWRDGFEHSISFKRGDAGFFDAKGNFAPGTKLKRAKAAKGRHGTNIRFWRDRPIFTDGADFDWARLVDRARQTAHLVAGLTITVTDLRGDEPITETFHADGGLVDLVTAFAPDPLLPDSSVLHLVGAGHYTERVPVLEGEEWVTREVERDMEVEVALRWGTGYEANVRGFVNVVDTPGGGTHVAGFERALVKSVVEAIGQTKLLRASEPAPTKDDVLEGVSACVAVRIAEPQFEGQTKEILGTPAARNIVAKVVTAKFAEWLAVPKNRKAARAVCTKVVEASRNRRALREQRDVIRRKNALESGSSLPDKLKDCSSDSPEHSEMLLVEGDSAMGSAKGARDARFQALLPLRGKILNVYKATEKAMLDNAECAAIVSAVGAGSGRSFNLDQARYGRIIIMCDADVDGSHIRTLLMTMFWRYMRPLVEAGRVFAAVPPLYRITLKGSGEHIYCYSEQDKVDRLAELEAAGKAWKDDIQRFKGLGEMDVDQLAETTLSVQTRTLRRVTVDDAQNAERLFEVLMGTDPALRRDWIAENSDLLDLARLDI